MPSGKEIFLKNLLQPSHLFSVFCLDRNTITLFSILAWTFAEKKNGLIDQFAKSEAFEFISESQ